MKFHIKVKSTTWIQVRRRAPTKWRRRLKAHDLMTGEWQVDLPGGATKWRDEEASESHKDGWLSNELTWTPLREPPAEAAAAAAPIQLLRLAGAKPRYAAPHDEELASPKSTGGPKPEKCTHYAN